MKTTKIHKTEKLPLDDEEIQLILDCFGDTVLECRNRCWVVLMCDSGLRRGEILSLKMCNVDLKHDFLLVTGKGCKERFVPLGKLSHDVLLHYIVYYRAGAGGTEPVFIDRFGKPCNDNTIKQVFQKIKKRTGIDRLHRIYCGIHLRPTIYVTAAISKHCGLSSVTPIYRLRQCICT